MQRHSKVHNDIEKSFACSQCSSVLSSQEKLSRHLKTVHEKNNFDCKECGKLFTKNKSLTRHMKEVHEQNIFDCNECGILFTRKESLEKHMKEIHEKKMNLIVRNMEHYLQATIIWIGI